MKKVLGFQVRSPGAPGPLTLKEVEELEQLTQQLMQDMEHPQPQNVAVNGESTAHLLGCLPIPVVAGACGSTPCLSQLILCNLTPFLHFFPIFSGIPRVLWPVSPAAGTCAACSSRSGAAVPYHLLYLSPV